MKRYQVQITHELELPDDCEVRSLAGVPVLKMGDVILHPAIEHFGAPTVTPEAGILCELSEDDRDRVYAAVARENTTIKELPS